jgi:hypothetical protein
MLEGIGATRMPEEYRNTEEGKPANAAEIEG